MTENQYRKADSKVLPVSLIIITGTVLNMLGMIFLKGEVFLCLLLLQ